MQKGRTKEEIEVDNRVHSRLIGQKGRAIRKLMDEYKVDIKFPRPGDQNPDLVVIMGAEENVLDAKEQILNLAEEYVRIKFLNVLCVVLMSQPNLDDMVNNTCCRLGKMRRNI